MNEFNCFQIRECPRNPHYCVSNAGDVYRIKRDGSLTRLRPWLDERGRPRVELWRARGEKPSQMLVSRLVAETFLGDPPPGKLLVLHWDDNPRHNAVANLRYGDKRDNYWDARRNGRMRPKYSDQDVERVRELGRAGWNLRAISDATGVSEGHASRILAGRSRPDRLNPDRP